MRWTLYPLELLAHGIVHRNTWTICHDQELIGSGIALTCKPTKLQRGWGLPWPAPNLIQEIHQAVLGIRIIYMFGKLRLSPTQCLYTSTPSQESRQNRHPSVLWALQRNDALIATSPGPKLHFAGAQITERSARMSLALSTRGANTRRRRGAVGRNIGCRGARGRRWVILYDHYDFLALRPQDKEWVLTRCSKDHMVELCRPP